MSRREFTVAVRRAAYDRAAGTCECGCNQPFTDHPKERPVYDHILPDALGGEPTLENCQCIRWCCHAVKTGGSDIKKIAKARRGEKERAGLTRKRSAFPTGRDSKFKAKIGGGVVLREGDDR